MALSKYNITVTQEQAKLLSLVLDLYSRMESGQLDYVFSMIPWKHNEDLKSAKPLLKELQLLLTGIQNGNLGIGNVSNSAKMAYDLHQVIRHRLSWDENPNGGIQVNFDKPMKWSDEPLAKIERIED